MSQRLPVPGSDDGSWGDILNGFLEVEHNPDGSLRPTGSLAVKADDMTVVHKTGNEVVAGTKTFSASPVVPTPTLGSQAANRTYVDDALSAYVPIIADGSIARIKLDSSTQTSLGKADTALQTAPVTSVNSQTGSVILAKTDVGLGNVDNTSDAIKPVSTATQTALTTNLASSKAFAIAMGIAL